jgi:murein DD-endopeptidase MepM/ murein hydrolase activator NlpD
MQEPAPRGRALSRISRPQLTLTLIAAAAALTTLATTALSPSGASSVPAVSAPSRPPPPPEPEPAAPAAVAATAEDPAEDLHIVVGAIARGSSLAGSLGAHGVGPDAVHLIAREMASFFDFRRAQPGHQYRLVQDGNGRVLEFHYRTSSIESYRLLLVGEDEYAVGREERELLARPARIAGVVTRSLYDAVRQLGEQPELASDFADVFAWDIDFSRSVRTGDEFRILYERLYRLDDEGQEFYVRPGRILAAGYLGSGQEHTAIYYEPEEGRGGYYRPDGSSVERTFLQVPLRYTRISSSYSGARRHPILKITRPHHGIDYAAPVGTPVWSVADGEVIHRARAGGFGNLVKIRHAKGYVSYYAHLSRYADGLRVGQKVQQKQVIGFVGETGLATGPHVCFRMSQDGRYVNPSQIRTPAGKPVPETVAVEFRSTRDILLAELGAGPILAAEEAL